MRVIKLLIIIAIMAFWVWIALINFGHSAEWTLPGLQGYLSWPVGLLMLLSFLLGAIPMWLIHRVSRWTWNRKLSKTEQKLAENQAPAPTMAPRDAEADLLARARAAGGVDPVR
jgi:lipopolysaccharide assembly protein A